MGIKSREVYLDKENNLIYDSTILSYLYSDELIECIRVRLAEEYVGSLNDLPELIENETVSKIRDSEAYKKFMYVTDINKAIGNAYGSSLSLTYEAEANKFHIVEEINRGEAVANNISTDIVCMGKAKVPEINKLNCCKCKELENVVIHYNYNYFDKEIILPDKEGITLGIVLRGHDIIDNYTKLDISGCSKYIKMCQSTLYEVCIERPIYIIPERCLFSSIRANEMNIMLETDKINKFKKINEEKAVIICMHSSHVGRLNVNIDGINYSINNAKYLGITFFREVSKLALSMYDEKNTNIIEKTIRI